MHYTHIEIKNGVATPVNPYTRIPRISIYDQFNQWSSTQIMPDGSGLVDRVYGIDELDIKWQWKSPIYGWMHAPLEDYYNDETFEEFAQSVGYETREAYTLKSPVPTSQDLIKDGYSEYEAGEKVEQMPYYEGLTESIIGITDLSEASMVYAVERMLDSKASIIFQHGANWYASQQSTLTERVKVLEGALRHSLIILNNEDILEDDIIKKVIQIANNSLLNK